MIDKDFFAVALKIYWVFNFIEVTSQLFWLLICQRMLQFNCNLAGVRQDGRASYFFHRSFETYNNENDANNCWKKIGTPRSIILDGTLRGCKEVFALYSDMTSDKSSQETDWRLHQYHLHNTVKAESEIVVSKIFLASRNSLCEMTEEARIESDWVLLSYQCPSL